MLLRKAKKVSYASVSHWHYQWYKKTTGALPIGLDQLNLSTYSQSYTYIFVLESRDLLEGATNLL